MRLLVLGGTRFVGRHVAAIALERGWSVSLFNRGREDPAAFPDAEHLRGDRDGDLRALAGREWDAVIDPSGYVPRLVSDSARALGDRVGHYVFVSSAGVYADKSQPGISEDAPLATLEDESTEDVGEHYDELKALCESALVDALGTRTTVVRPGLIAGPNDPTNRFTYWVTRIAAGGAVVAPEPRDQPVQVIDVRDLAAWMLDLAELRTAGTFNAVGEMHSMEEVLGTVKAATASDARLVWTPEARLAEEGVQPWTDMPLWLAPEGNPDYRGFLAIDNSRAKAAGLVLRPLERTARDTWEWARTAPAAAGVKVGTLHSPPAGLDPDVEARLLA